MRRVWDIGTQYDWLAQLAEAEDWRGVELSIYGEGRLGGLLRESVRRYEGGDGRAVFAVRPDSPEPVRLVFGRFAFPFWETGKHEAVRSARDYGLASLLDKHAWFCFSPRNGEPCGLCRPCRFVVNDGLGDRIPYRGHLRYAVRQARKAAGVRTRLRRLRRYMTGLI